MRRAIYPGSAQAVARISITVVLALFTSLKAWGGNERSFQTFESGPIAFTYSKEYFENARSCVLLKKIDNGSMPADVGPERWMIVLTHPSRSHGHEADQTTSAIYITPLRDPSERAFAKAYPVLTENLHKLEQLLIDRPANLDDWSSVKSGAPAMQRGVPDEPFSNAAAFLLAKFRILQGRSVRFLTYYRQDDTGIGATNLDLFYNFQGTTSERGYYISARIAVRHPKLADSEKDPGAHAKGQATEHDRIDRWNDNSFYPPLTALDAMMASIKLHPINL